MYVTVASTKGKPLEGPGHICHRAGRVPSTALIGGAQQGEMGMGVRVGDTQVRNSLKQKKNPATPLTDRH